MEIFRNINSNRLTAALLLGVGSFMVTGCGDSPEIVQGQPGEVTGHFYDDRDVRNQLIGKIIVPRVEPERFLLEVRQCDRPEDNFADENGCVTQQVEVSEETYESYPDGSIIVFNK